MSRVFGNERMERQIKILDDILSNPDNYTKDDLLLHIKRQKKHMEAAKRMETERNTLMADLQHLNTLNDLAFKGFATFASSHEMAGILSHLSAISKHNIEDKVLAEDLQANVNRLESIFIGFKNMGNFGIKQFHLSNLKEIVRYKSHHCHDIIIDDSCEKIDNESLYTHKVILYTIFYNLIANGIYFSRERLRSINSNENPKVQIIYDNKAFYVSDDGAGLTKEAENNLFKYGFTTRYRGNGFGLTLCKEYADKYDMGLEYVPDSEFNVLGGACFKVSLTKP